MNVVSAITPELSRVDLVSFPFNLFLDFPRSSGTSNYLKAQSRQVVKRSAESPKKRDCQNESVKTKSEKKYCGSVERRNEFDKSPEKSPNDQHFPCTRVKEYA